LALSDGLGAASAEQINQGGQRFEGIERIDPSGAVHFTESRMQALTRTLGYQCRSMELAEVGDWADELQAKYRAYVERLGITATEWFNRFPASITDNKTLLTHDKPPQKEA